MRTTTVRPVPLALAATIAVISALVALAAAGHNDAQARGTYVTDHNHAAHATTVRKTISRSELALRADMRRLWTDHVVWTRLAIISLTSGSADADATVARLLRNQTDIGNAIKPFYGRAAGSALTALLRDHIAIAAELIAAAKAGNETALSDAQARWQRNADDIAAFLSKANRRWTLRATKSMLAEHLTLTTQEAVARLRGEWNADVVAYDRIQRHALTMADTFSAGLVAQFPRRFK